MFRLKRKDEAEGGGILSVLAYGPKGRQVWGVSWQTATEIVREKRLEPVDQAQLDRVDAALERSEERLGKAMSRIESLEKRLAEIEDLVTKP